MGARRRPSSRPCQHVCSKPWSQRAASRLAYANKASHRKGAPSCLRLLIVPETPCLMQPWSERKTLVGRLRLATLKTMLHELNVSAMYHRALFQCNRRVSRAEPSYLFSHSPNGPMTPPLASPHAVSVHRFRRGFDRPVWIGRSPCRPRPLPCDSSTSRR